jgi:ABC-type multidrug transport system fused ATPase/permease subunit
MSIIIGIGILLAVLYWLGWQWITGIVFLIVALITFSIYASNKREKEHRIALLTKYLGDIETVDKIMSHSIWEGQTTHELIDSLGEPVEVDEKILKTKSKEIWKYNQTGKGRFALRITLENNVVIGWDKKA